MFPYDKATTVTDRSDQLSHEENASGILRCHYSTLALSLQYPVRIAQLLSGQEIISTMSYITIKFYAESPCAEKATPFLLKRVRHAVHTNYQNLELFASVMIKCNSNVPCANAILEDCGKYMSYTATLV